MQHTYMQPVVEDTLLKHIVKTLYGPQNHMHDLYTPEEFEAREEDAAHLQVDAASAALSEVS